MGGGEKGKKEVYAKRTTSFQKDAKKSPIMISPDHYLLSYSSFHRFSIFRNGIRTTVI